MKNFFKLTFKDGIYISILICVVLYFVFHKKPQQVVYITNPISELTSDSLKHYLDANNKLTTKITTLVVAGESLGREVDSLAKILKIKPKEIKGVDHYITQTITKTDTIHTLVKDTAGNCVVSYTDGWNSVAAITDKDCKVGWINIIASDTISTIATEKTNLFGKTTRELLIQNSNPNVTINKGNSIRIKEKRAFLTLGPSIQFNPFTKKLDYGVSMQFPIIQFKK